MTWLYFLLLWKWFILCGIYKVTNKINGKCYIGQAINIKTRWYRHRNDAFDKKCKHYHSAFYQAIRKYGLENFTFEVLEECNPNELDDKEITYIAQYNSFGENGYNLTAGGRSALPVDVSSNIVLQIIQRLKTTEDRYDVIANDFGVKTSTIHHINNGKCCYQNNESYPIRQPLGRLAAYHNQCLVCGKTIEVRNMHCAKCSSKINNLKQRRVKRPDYMILVKMIIDIGFVQTGKYFGVSDNAIKKWLKNDNLPFKKNELVAWYNEHMGIVPEPKPTKKTIDEIVRPVHQIDKTTGKIINTFACQADALRNLGISSPNNHISQVCRGLRKSAHGYFWKYA